MHAVQTSAPAAEPVSLSEAKAHLRVDASDDDALITALIVAARNEVEAKTGRRYVTQSWRATFDDFSDLRLPGLTPVSTVDSVKYTDTAGVEQTLSSAKYRLIAGAPDEVVVAYGETWPGLRDGDVGAVRVTVTCGYGNAAAVPQPIKQWMLLRIATLYENRADYGTVRDAASVVMSFADAMLDPFKVVGL